MEYYNPSLDVWSEADTMLERLSNNRVFDIDPYNKSAVVITEGCDSVFEDTLTKQDLLMLANELIELANKLED